MGGSEKRVSNIITYSSYKSNIKCENSTGVISLCQACYWSE